MSLSVLYPTISPSLLLDFANSGVLDPRVTFTRHTGGTYFGPDGVLRTAQANAPRFDYNPATLAAQGLLIEEQRTNLLTYSEQFDNAAWSKANSSVTANATTSPANTVTADTFVEAATTSQHIIWQGRSGTNETTTFTVFAKQSTRSRIKMEMSNFATASCGAFFDLAAGTVVLTDFPNADYTNPSASITSVGNGWFRCSLTVTKGSVNTVNNPSIMLATGTTTNYTGDGTSGLYIWGAQLEVGAFPTSYIPTTTTALTRAEDLASVNTLSPWFNASEGTLYAEASVPVPAAYTGFVYLFGTFADGIMYFRQSDFQPVDRVRVSSTDQFINGFGATWNTAAAFKNAQAYKANDFAGSVNGGAVATDPSGTVPSVSVLQIGGLGSGSSPINGHIRRITYYPVRLPDAQLQAITA